MSVIVKSLTYFHPDKKLLFEDLDITISKGEKAALVGNNGTGKSTFLQIIAGKLSPTTGQVTCPEKPWYIPQHLGQYNGLSIAQALQVDKKIAAFRAILNGNINQQYFTDLEDDWEIEEKVKSALQHWGLNSLSADVLVGDLSGGQKTKVFLAGIDIHQPGIILMDEPSNHLDITSREQLYHLVTTSKATILAVSHDRTLLNLLPETFELSARGIQKYGGNFDFYRRQKAEQVNALQNRLEEQSKTLRQSQQKARELAEQRQKKEIRGKAAGKTNSLPRIVAGGLKNKAEGSTAKVMAVHNEKVAGIVDNIRQIRSEIQQYQVLKIDIGASALHPGKTLVDAANIVFAYSGNHLWSPLSFQIRSGERIRVEGDNGSGKTTLLKIITGELKPTEGIIQRQPFTYLYLDQDYTMINPQLSIYEQIQHYNSRGLQEHELKSLLIYSQFPREMFDRKSTGLSGGEKMKLSLCCLAVGNYAPDILILDEPTNNLDVQSLEILTATVRDFNGTILTISHDQYFINEIGIDKHIFVIKRLNPRKNLCQLKTPEPKS
ncbi:MAG: ABC-F family ATP-binding cassette domain-containing protein [Mucilaginibacter sp.]